MKDIANTEVSVAENPVVEEPLKLEEAVVSAKPAAPGTLRYHHKLAFRGISVYATEVTQGELSALKKAGKKATVDGKQIAGEQKKLNAELTKLREVETGDDEDLSDTETRIEAIEARLEELSEIQERSVDSQLELIEGIVRNHVVALSWKEGEKGREKEVFSREVNFESRAAINEIGEMIITKSRLGMGEFNNLKAR